MVKTVEELKELILWAKEQKISSIKIGEVAFEISAYALLDSTTPYTEQPTTEGLSEPDETQKTEDDNDLYWSTR